MPVPKRVSALPRKGCPSQGPRRLTRRFHRLSAARGWVAYALRTRPPLSPPRRGVPARLACIRPAASVHPEPGSNSSLYYCFSVFLFRLMGSALLSLFIPSRSAPPDPLGPTRLPVLASSFQRTFRFPFPFKSTPLFCGSGLQRYDLFGNWQSKNSIIFDKILYYFENQLNKILIFYKKT